MGLIVDILTATKIIQEQATANGNSFDDEFWNIANSLQHWPKDVYTAWSVFHNSVNEYFVRSEDRSRIQRLAREVKGFNVDQQAYFNSL